MYRPIFNDWLISIGQFLNRPRSRGSVKKTLILLFGFTLAVSTWLLSLPYIEADPDYNLGDTAVADLRVPYDIRYALKDETEKLRREAFSRERPVFDRNDEAFRKASDMFQTELSVLKQTIAEGSSSQVLYERFEFLKNKKLYTKKMVKALINSSPAHLETAGREIKSYVYNNVVVLPNRLSADLKNTIDQNASYIRTTHSAKDVPEAIWDTSRFMTLSSIAQNHQRILKDSNITGQLSESASLLLLLRASELLVQYNVFSYNEHQSQRRKKLAADSISPVTATLVKGTFLVKTGDLIDREAFNRIKILQEYRNTSSFRILTGMFLIMTVLAFSVGFFIFRFSTFAFRELSSHIILHFLIFIVMASAYFLTRFDIITDSEIFLGLFVPVAFFSMTSGILFGPRVTLVVGLYLSVFLYLFSGSQAGTIMVALTGTFTGIYAAARMQTRMQFIKGAYFIAIGNIVIFIGMALIENHQGKSFGLQMALSVVNAIFSIALTVTILPMLERIFNLSTKFRLQELADVNSPLLKRMAMKAPSTFSHSLMMANLSERAVAAIGGNSLLAKVGCLYHDIGKMLNPELYTENKHLLHSNESSKKFGPEKTAKLIIRHVADGIRMARENRLPENVIAFIPEHHGTTTMQYFYHKTLEQNSKTKKGRLISRQDFQYPGPKPKSKETGVVMIADSLEAASRSLKEATYENFRNLVDEIIQNKMNENQFDECLLTIADFTKIKASFVEVLMGYYHLRPAYPKFTETQNLERQNVANISGNHKAVRTKSTKKAVRR